MLQQSKLRFSSLAAHRAAAVVLSPDRLTVTQTSNEDAWVRCERGFAPGCGAVKWVVKLGDVSGGKVNVLGVVSDAFTERNNSRGFFDSGDVVSVELERRPGQDGVMRVRVAGRAPKQDMTGLPRDGMLYPAVCLHNDEQSYTMLPHRRE